MYVILRHFVIYSTIQLCVSVEVYSQYLLNLQVFYRESVLKDLLSIK